MSSQTLIPAQDAHAEQVPVRRVSDPETLIFPEDAAETNCTLCGEIRPCRDGLCAKCEADLGTDALASLADRLLAEEDSTLAEALRIASGEDRLTLPTRAHLKALVDAMQRHESYTKALECCIAQAQRNADRATEGLQNAAMLYAESEAIH